MVRTIPGLPDVNGRPILHDMQPGIRHLAYYRADTWYTWCGLPVPADHRCPSDDVVRQAFPWHMRSCHECYARYSDGRSKGKPLSTVADLRNRAPFVELYPSTGNDLL